MRGKPLKKQETKRLEPVASDDFAVLFRHGYDRGAGRILDPQGIARPWTVLDLEAAFDALGRDISIKTLENWRAGRTVPNRRNMHALARIFSGHDKVLANRWLDALLASRIGDTISGNESGKGIDARTEGKARHKAQAPRAIGRTAGLAVATVVGLLALGGGAWLAAIRTPEPDIHTLRFCTEADFDRAAQRCRADRRLFAEGTDLIHVSFETNDMPPRQPFTRTWYREGSAFLSRDGFFDEVWNNWTWIGNPNGHDAGTYHLRIVVDGKVTTESFRVEGEVIDPNPNWLPENRDRTSASANPD